MSLPRALCGNPVTTGRKRLQVSALALDPTFKVRDCAHRVDIEGPEPLLDNRHPVHDFPRRILKNCLQEQHHSRLSTAG